MKNERIEFTNTERLYETDGMLYEFEGKVISCEMVRKQNCPEEILKKNCPEETSKQNCPEEILKQHCPEETSKQIYAVELDRTAFFPEGGGQGGDTGRINDGRVFDTRINDEGRILHYCDTSFKPGDTVKGVVDFDIRFLRMQNHGAEHLVCGIIHNLYGYDNNGFHMNDEGVIFDVDGLLTKEQIHKVEKMANEAVYKCLPITISFPGEEEAKNLKYRSKLDTFTGIRLVTISNMDVCACCAPQLYNTGQIGLVKIIDYFPHRGGTRMTLLAGRAAYEDYAGLSESNSKIMAMLSSKRSEVAEYVSDFMNRDALLKEENTSLKKELVEVMAKAEIEKIKSLSCLPCEAYCEEEKSEIERADDGLSSVISREIIKVIRGCYRDTHIIYAQYLDTTGLRNLVNKCVAACGGVVAGFCPRDDKSLNYIIGRALKKDACGGTDAKAQSQTDIKADAKEETKARDKMTADENLLPCMSKALNDAFTGRGGGNSKMVQGSVSKPMGIDTKS